MSCPAAKRAKLEIGGEETTPSLEEDSSFPGDGEGEESSPWCHSEKGVGITEFRSDTPGFFGILKRRYCDFVVHEVASDGGVVKLTNYSLPIEVNKEELSEGELECLVGPDVMAAIRKMVEEGQSAETEEVSFQVSLDKAGRGKMHRTLRTLYPNLESETVEEASKSGEGQYEGACQPQPKTIVLRRISASKNVRTNWPRGRGSYCHFVLYKESKSTMEAAMVLSRLLKVKPKNFSYAGTKDKRAISSQKMAAFKISAEKLQTINKRLLGMAVGNFQYSSSGLALGDLDGNQFSIVLRSVSCDDHVISEGMEALSTRGFINYFGMQRFGSTSVPTHHIGRCLLHSDWKGAIDLILKPKQGDSEELGQAKEFYESSGGDIAGTLALLPKSFYIERCLLSGLKKRQPFSDFCGAFSFIPRNTRTMYVHGWQSWCWNQLVSWRLKHLGMHPVPGDLAVKEKGGEVTYITESDVSGYSLSDVVLPLPGYSIQLPKHGVKEEYERILTEEKVGMDQLHLKIKSLALPGSYRRIVVLPTDVQWSILCYDDFKVPLILTDLDRLAARKLPDTTMVGGHKALKLEFTLPSSSYATMAVRELIKMETSSAYQASLGE